ncbi:MAG: CapA family protein [Gemmatimonadota bacterium]|nr:CapA family protein [Gemmatimonadota bacterium]MDQ8173190.1 CapA family protein [Gemmatimonadota bacterium]
MTASDHPDEPTVRVTIVGDIMPGDSAVCVGWGMASRWPGHHFRRAIRKVESLFQHSEIVLGNLEAPLTPNGTGKTRWHRDQMRAAPEVAHALSEAGFTVMGTANNHANQHGALGYADTINALDSAGLIAIGRRGIAPWATRPEILTRNGIRVGFLGYCWRPRQYGQAQPPFAEGSLAEAVSDVRRLAQLCDVTVVSLHWGDEFFAQPSDDQTSAARQLVEAGARIVVGHHPHVMRPIERYHDGVIAYSLGNFCSDMFWLPEARVGAVLTCVCTKNALKSITTTTIEIGSDFSVTVSPKPLPTLSGRGLPVAEYSRAVRQSLRRQQLLAYRYVARNVHRFSGEVFFELLTRTVRNKLLPILKRVR